MIGYKILYISIRLERALGSAYQCEQCENSFSSEFNLRNHVEVIHEGKRFECKECGEQLASAFRAGEHISSQHAELNMTKNDYSIVWVPVSNNQHRTESEKNKIILEQKEKIAALRLQLNKLQKKNASLTQFLLNRGEKSYNLRSGKSHK